MKKEMINQTHIEGILYAHKLETKESGKDSKNPGTPYVTGTIDIATDDAHTNIVSVHFTYVAPTYPAKDGKPPKQNVNYPVLMNIINGKIKTVMDSSWSDAARIRVDSAIGLNEFYSERDGEEVLVSAKRNEGGFIHVITDNNLDADEKHRNTFKVDMVITSTAEREGDPDKGIADSLIVKGCIFDFRKALLPVEFVATNPGAINYFLGLGASSKEPVFTNIWGNQVSTTVTRTITEESAFGEPSIRETSYSRKDWVITGARTETYEWDSEDTITVNELKKAMSDRETALATMKQRAAEWRANQANAIKTTAAPATGDFKF